MTTTPADDLREQIRTDVREHRRGSQAQPFPVGPGRILLETPHHPIVVRLADIDEVRRIAHPRRRGLHGRVTLHDGSFYDVPDPDVVVRALREERARHA